MADEAVKNRNVYLAKKLLGFLDNTPKEIPFISIKSNNLSASEKDLPKLFSGLTTQEALEGFFALERFGALKYEKKHPKLGNKNYSFNLTLQPNKIQRFITTAESNIFDFRLSDERYLRILLLAIEMLINSDDKVIELGDFYQRVLVNNSYEVTNLYEILQKVADFSSAILIQKKSELNPKFSGIGNIVIKDREELETILGAIKKKVKDVNKNNVNIFLKENKKLEWLCRGCERWFGSFSSEQEIIRLLDGFSNGKYKNCHKCRSKNFFTISPNGKIKFLIVKEDIT
jgi:hypothetical protein